MTRLQQRVLLIVVLLLSFSLRVWGSKFALPLFYPHTDETLSIFKGIRSYSPYFIEGSTPNIMHYFIGGVDKLITSGKTVVIENYSIYFKYTNILFIARVFSAFISTLSVLLTYFIINKLFKNYFLALLSALFLGITFADVQMAHYLRQDVYTHFLGLLAIFTTVLYLKKPRIEYLALLGIFAGISATIRLNGLLFLIPLVFLMATRIKEIGLKDFITNGFLILTYVLIGYFISMPAFFIHTPPDKWLPMLVLHPLNVQGDATYASSANGMPSFVFFIVYLMKVGMFYPLFFTSIVGLILFLVHKNRYKFFFVSFPALYFVIISLRSTRFDRLITAITPFLAFFAAYFLYFLNTRSKFLTYLVFLVVVGFSVYRIGLFDKALTQKYPAEIALSYIYSNFPKDARITFAGATNQLGGLLRNLGFTNTRFEFDVFGEESWDIEPGFLVVEGSNIKILENYRNTSAYRTAWHNYHDVIDRSTFVASFENKTFESGWIAPDNLEHSCTVKAYHHPIITIYGVSD